MPTLSVLIASTRPGRAGLPVGEWFLGRAQHHGKFAVEQIDLKQLNLPMLDEPHHPRLQKYEHEHTKAWSAQVKRNDAFVFVTPEYNYGPPPALVNAFDYLYVEWNYKPCGFVSYGGVSGGTRSVQVSKGIATTLKMMPMVETVAIPFVTRQIQNGVFNGDETQDKSATVMLDELLRWTEALRVLR